MCRLLFLILMTSGASAFSLAQIPLGDRQSNDENLRWLAEGYSLNRDSFPFITCTLQHIEGKARNVEAALRGELLESISSEVLWVVNGSKVKFDQKCSGSAPLSPDDGFREPKAKIETICDTFAMLYDGEHVLKHWRALKTANIYPPQSKSPEIRITPFGMGVMGPDEENNPASIYRRCISGKLFGVYDGAEAINGSELVKTRTGPGKDQLVATRWLDPKRGFLPIRTEVRVSPNGKLSYTCVIKGIKACSAMRWFPMHSIVVLDPERESGPIRARILKVMDLDVDTIPKDQLFQIDIPPNTQISEPTSTTGPAVFTTTSEERINVNDLGQLLERCRSFIPRWIKVMDEGRIPSNVGYGYTIWVFLLNVTIGSLIVLYIFRKRFIGLITHKRSAK